MRRTARPEDFFNFEKLQPGFRLNLFLMRGPKLYSDLIGGTSVLEIDHAANSSCIADRTADPFHVSFTTYYLNVE